MSLRSGATSGAAAAAGGSPEPQDGSNSGPPQPSFGSPAAAAQPPVSVHGMDTESVFVAVDTSLAETAESLPKSSMVGLDSVRDAVNALATAQHINPTLASSLIMELSAQASTIDQVGKQALATMADATKSLLGSVIEAHNTDLSTTQEQVSSLESRLTSAIHAHSASEINLSIQSAEHKRVTDTLSTDIATLRAEPRVPTTSAEREALSAKEHFDKHHRVWQKLDPLVQTRARQIELERKLISSQLVLLNTATEASAATDEPELSFSSMLSTGSESENLAKAIKTVSTAIQHLDRCIDTVMSDAYSLPISNSVKSEYKLHLSSKEWKRCMDLVYEAKPCRELGLQFATAIYQLILAHPKQLFTCVSVWARVLGQYTATTTPSDYLIPSRWKLVRNAPGTPASESTQPTWVDNGIVDCNEGVYRYSKEFAQVFAAQNDLLYGMLSRICMGAADEAMAGSAHGRYGADRVVYRASPSEGLNLLYYYVQRHRQISFSTVAALEEECANSHIILAKEPNILKGLRAWRELASRGMKLHLRVKYTSLIWRCCQVIKTKSPVELGEIVGRYLVSPPARFEEDSLHLVHQIVADCESALIGFQHLLQPARSRDPLIRARRAEGGGNLFGGGGRNASGPRRSGPNQRATVEGNSRVTCSTSRCSAKVPNKALPKGFKDGDVHHLTCFECWQKSKKGSKQGERTRAMAANAYETHASKSGRPQRTQRRDRDRGGSGRGRGAPRTRDQPGWMSRRQDSPAVGAGGSFTGKCYNCDKVGHRAADCGKQSTRRAMTARVSRVQTSPATGANTTPVGARQQERDQRDGYLGNTRLYMVRILRPQETMLLTYQDNVVSPYLDNRTLLTCPNSPATCKDVRCARAKATMDCSGSLLMTVLCDTGASSSIFSGSIDGFLQNARPSAARITGFDASASPVRAGMRGTLAIYAMQTKHTKLATEGEYYSQKGELIRLECDTVPGMVDSLLSYSDLHHEGWNLRIVTKAGNRECSIEKTDEHTGKSRTIPLFYDKTRRGFVAYLCVGRNSGLVHRRGRATEKKLQALSLTKGRAATLCDLGYSDSTGKPPYAIEGQDLCAAAAAIHEILPNSIHISTEVNGEQCYGNKDTLTITSLTDERKGMGPNLRFSPAKVSPAGADRADLSPVEEEDDEAIDLHRLLHCTEKARDNYLFMSESAVHPYERGKREKERQDGDTRARVARMTTEGPLGFSQLSGARALADADTESCSDSDSHDGNTPSQAIELSSSGEKVSPEAGCRAPPSTPVRRRLSEGAAPKRARKSRPPGLAAADTDLPAHEALLHGARLTAEDRAAIKREQSSQPKQGGDAPVPEPHAGPPARRRSGKRTKGVAAGDSAPANKAEQRTGEVWQSIPHRPDLSDEDRAAIQRALLDDGPEGKCTREYHAGVYDQMRADARTGSTDIRLMGTSTDAQAGTDLVGCADVESHDMDSHAGREFSRQRAGEDQLTGAAMHPVLGLDVQTRTAAKVTPAALTAIERSLHPDAVHPPGGSHLGNGMLPPSAAGVMLVTTAALVDRRPPRVTRALALLSGDHTLTMRKGAEHRPSAGDGGQPAPAGRSRQVPLLARTESRKGPLSTPSTLRVPTSNGIIRTASTTSTTIPGTGLSGDPDISQAAAPRPTRGAAHRAVDHLDGTEAHELQHDHVDPADFDTEQHDHDDIVVNAASQQSRIAEPHSRRSPAQPRTRHRAPRAQPEPDAGAQAAAIADIKATREADRSSIGDEPTGTDLDDFIEDFDCPGITGTKRSLNPREMKLTTAHLHRRYGHIGNCGDQSGCALCQMLGGSFFRRGHKRSKVPADPELPGYRWAVDIVFMSTPAISGEMYACVMRDCCSGFYAVSYDKTKSFGRHIVNTIKSMRARPHFQGFSYPIFSELRSDHDGSWFLEGDTQRELDELGVECIFSGATSTDTSRANAFAEAAVRFITHTTKMILLQNRLPTSFWKWAMDQSVQIRNLFPIRKYANNVYSGDALRPLEQITRSRISRMDCNQLLSALCPVGSLNLVHQAQLNSTDLGTPTARWGICIGNMGKIAIFFCPYAGARSARFYSRNWMGIELPAGLGYHAALNIEPTESEVAPPGVTIPPCDRDLKLKNIISIPNLNALTAGQRRVWSPVVSLKTGKLEDGKTPSIIMINDEGVVYAHDSEGNITRTDQVLTLAERTAPNTSIVNHLHDSGINIPRSLDPHRTFDPVILMTAPSSLIGMTFWMHYPNHGYWLATIRLYDPSAKLWTATFRDGTFLDLHMRELEIMMVDRPDDPNTEMMDMSTGIGRDTAARAAEGPDTTGPLPEKLLTELRDDLGDDALHSNDGTKIPWSEYTVVAVQAALENPERLLREGIVNDEGDHVQRTSPPRSTPVRSRRKQARPARVASPRVHAHEHMLGACPADQQARPSSPRYYGLDRQESPALKAARKEANRSRARNGKTDFSGPADFSRADRLHHQAATRGATGRTRGLNPKSRLEAQAASKRHKSDLADGGVYPEHDNDGLPWSDTVFNWSGYNLPPPAESETPYFEVNFAEWVQEGHETVTADDETFSQLCERMNLDTKQARLYWMFLGKYYGPSVGARTDLSVCTRRMPCPWGRTQRSALLVNGQVFPKPKGRLWNQLLEQQRLKDNGGNTEHESVRLARAYITAIAAHERQQDAIVRATSDKAALQDATIFMTDYSVHEQDDDKKGSQLRAMLARMGGGTKRLAPTFATLGLIASIASGKTGDMDPRGYHPVSTWVQHQKENGIHLDVNAEGLIQIYSNRSTKAYDDARALRIKNMRPVQMDISLKSKDPANVSCFKAKKAVQDAARKGEDPINPLTGRIRPPKSIKDIAGRPDEAIWLAAIKEEVASLESMGVFHNDLTIEQCREMGVTTSPVPLMITFDAKHTPLGTFDRAKARICVAGSPHWMKAGVHYGLTFAATPAHEITRILMALCVARGYARFQWDIKSAFMSTPIKPQDRIILRYPKGAERYDEKGRPLYAILDKVLYGVPSASRKFGQYLKKWIMERFSKDGFTVKFSRSEPCLYIITNKAKRTLFLSIFTDDCQIVGPNINDLKEIGEIFATKFEIKICDSQELLGVRRVIKKETDGSTSMYMTQPGFIESTCKEFAPQYEEVFGKKKMITPFPPREMLSRSEIPDDPVLAKKTHQRYSKEGSMSMTGCILWAARNTMPELSYGVSQLCRMMSTPTEKSYNFALHMVSYMSTQIHRGIRYNSNGNHQLIGHYDSSLKPDPADSKCQYGFVFYWQNGPICWSSRKHNHVSLSTTQAEYQALAHCARAAVWLRNMFKDMGLSEYVQGPTILLGDCINANMLAKEDKVTAQNRHILMSYHYAKEMVEIGEICPRRVTTKLNSSDLLTKANPRPDLERLVPVLTGLGGEHPPIPDLPRD